MSFFGAVRQTWTPVKGTSSQSSCGTEIKPLCESSCTFLLEIDAWIEMALIEKGCPKLNLQIRNDNTKAINFYQKVGYKEDAAVSFGKRLIED